MLCDVYISKRTDFRIPGYTQFNSTFEFYFLAVSVLVSIRVWQYEPYTYVTCLKMPKLHIPKHSRSTNQPVFSKQYIRILAIQFIEIETLLSARRPQAFG